MQVTINLRECIVEDFQPDSATGGEKKSTQKLGNDAGAVSLLIRIMHKVGDGSGVGVGGLDGEGRPGSRVGLWRDWRLVCCHVEGSWGEEAR